MKRLSYFLIIYALFVSGIFSQKEEDKSKPKKPEKHFKREEKFPAGRQTNSLIGSFLSGLRDANTVAHLFDSSYKDVWAAVKRAAKKLDKEGGRPVIGIDEENGRIQNGEINQNALIGSGLLAWLDMFVSEATDIGGATKVSVTRKVVQNDIKRDHSREWKTQYSNGKIERWFLTQVEDELANPTAQGDSLNERPLPAVLLAASAKIERLTNQDILSMIEAKVPDSIIIAKIKKSQPDFDTSTSAIISLKKAGVSDGVIQEMIATSKN